MTAKTIERPAPSGTATPPRRRRRPRGEGLSTVLIHLELVLVAAVVIFPLLWVVGASLSPGDGLGEVSPFPSEATVDHYVNLFTETAYGRWYLNSLYVAVLNMAGSVVLAAVCGFVFSRVKFKGRKAGLLSILILQMFPAFLAAIAVYMLFLNFGLLDSLTGLALVSIAGALPYNIWLMKGYTDNLPASLDEAAAIDGAGRLTIFVKIILPLMRPMLTFVAITQFTLPWMDFILPRLVLQSADKQTVALGLFNMISSEYANSYTTFAAGAVVLALPITILYIVLQRYLVTGASAGAEKG
ncbi:sugar ABC transporter permease [Glycomyces algeriensis]|uniref:Sugar ABC transporter permease n=1 Tax=Glycomyces algeriensis TaxID=256037 RepID=A0A9W6LHQ0_9ACTN|nr:sugar ABC transporter permease [Glycomyces algeriensis]MDA1364778.1 sugar ABC transporter permease [Glycomyces algeriensis]MDR7350819.1 arabinogalactan oligomer/maltooligosaccharide transport system permease protein [Glycomyces algeriensis]GLI43530.1 sugar ABC transporter permease [Glycomyces algeriensis]